MKRLAIATSLLCVLALGVPAEATYTSIQMNLLNATPDTSYSGGVLTILDAPVTGLTLNDPGPMSGTVSNIMFSLITNFLFTRPGSGPTGEEAVFGGGSVSLSFNFNGSPYSIGGPIENMIFFVSQTASPGRIAGEGLFSALFDLPGSNDWPAPDLSSIESLTLAIGQSLAGFDWDTGTLSGNVQSQVTLYPDARAIPAPATLLLLVPGLALLRRRR